MLERVTLHQTRFTIPGVSLDSRGVLLGREGAVLVSSVDRVVAFFRVFGAENNLNDMLSGLRISRVTTPLKTQEFVIFFPAANSYLLDQAAKVARLVDGQLFTGSTKHYVAYRDAQAPLGYDARELLRGEGEVALYAPGFEQLYTRASDLDFGALVRRLSLERLKRREEFEQGDTLFLRAPLGLSGAVQGYLVRNGVSAQIAIVDRVAQSAFAEAPQPFYLFKITQLPARMRRLFPRVPGATLFYPALPNVLVQWGFRHPIRLEACSSLFPDDQFFFFDGDADKVEATKETPSFFEARDRTRLSYQIRKGQEVAPVETGAPVGEITVALSLVPTARPVERVIATLIPWQLLEPLKSLVYALPPELLREYRVCATPRFLVVMNPARGKDGSPRGIERLPLGTMMWEAGPAIYLPVGHSLLPRVSPEALSAALGTEPGVCYFFAPNEPAPFALKESSFLPLERAVLARMPTDLVESVAGEAPRLQEPHLINDEVGRFSLWSHRPAPSDLPAEEGEA
jgi:hypothetical protein